MKNIFALATLFLMSTQAMSQTSSVCPSNLFVYDQFLFQAVEKSKRFATRTGQAMCEKLHKSNASIAIIGGYNSYGSDTFSINLTFALKDNRTGFISTASAYSVNFFAQEFMSDDQKREKAAQMIDDALNQWNLDGNFQRALGEFDRAASLVKLKP